MGETMNLVFSLFLTKLTFFHIPIEYLPCPGIHDIAAQERHGCGPGLWG